MHGTDHEHFLAVAQEIEMYILTHSNLSGITIILLLVSCMNLNRLFEFMLNLLLCVVVFMFYFLCCKPICIVVLALNS